MLCITISQYQLNQFLTPWQFDPLPSTVSVVAYYAYAILGEQGGFYHILADGLIRPMPFPETWPEVFPKPVVDADYHFMIHGEAGQCPAPWYLPSTR
jgi:hypothetical protein